MVDEIQRRCPFCGGPIDTEHMDPLLQPIMEECWECPWYKKIVEVMIPVLLVYQQREAMNHKKRL